MKKIEMSGLGYRLVPENKWDRNVLTVLLRQEGIFEDAPTISQKFEIDRAKQISEEKKIDMRWGVGTDQAHQTPDMAGYPYTSRRADGTMLDQGQEEDDEEINIGGYCRYLLRQSPDDQSIYDDLILRYYDEETLLIWDREGYVNCILSLSYKAGNRSYTGRHLLRVAVVRACDDTVAYHAILYPAAISTMQNVMHYVTSSDGAQSILSAIANDMYDFACGKECIWLRREPGDLYDLMEAEFSAFEGEL